jgi:hypothetical protein
MRQTRRNTPIEAAQIYEATEEAGNALARFIDFIEYHNPDIDRATATLTAAYYLRSYACPSSE